MTRRLVIAMTLMAAIVAAALAVPMVILVASDQRSAFVSQLEVETLSAASILASEPESMWAATVEDVAAQTGARVVVVDKSANLVADSDNSGLDRTFDRPEIQSALLGSLTSDVRYSATLATDLRYVAAPVVKDESVVAAVRLSLPEDEVVGAVRRTQAWLFIFVLAVVLAAGLVAWLLARSFALPLDRLAEVARVLPDDLDARADEGNGPREIRSVASALNTTAARLSELVHRTQRVAADASHHLRTPLTGLRLRLEAIEETSESPEVTDQAKAATAEVDRLTRRIDQVLALARSDAGGGGMDVVDVSTVVADRVAAHELLIADRGLRIDDVLTPDVEAYALAGSVPRCVDELIGNAIHYARSTVRVSVEEDGEHAAVTVEDDGPGIPEADRERIFERFVRGEHAVDGGSGLGLALVRESARASGGSAEVRRGALGGLAVRVWWPRVPGTEAISDIARMRQ